MGSKKIFINTMGCQMNVYDSGQILKRMAPLGFSETRALNDADVIIVNTCAIRAKAEQKAFSFLGRLAPLKTQKPELIIGIGGCVAQQEGRRILSRMPHVDLVFGTQAVARLPELISRIARTRCRLVDVTMAPSLSATDFAVDTPAVSEVSEFVTIMRGCDNFCTYCVVPYVRGRESSRAPDEVIAEIQGLVACGVREVTLLGQNVNSYGIKEGLGTFDQLLERVNAVEGLARIRFTTSHPKDLSPGLMESFRRLDKLCPHIHLPVQSGSDDVLKRMNRRYTRAHYLEKIERLRAIRPDIAITSDIIVGFPGETERDFEATLALIREVGFDGLFAFIYSDRPNAPAVQFAGKVAEAVKKERLQQVLNHQEAFTLRAHQAMVGGIEKILVDGLNDGRRPPLEAESHQTTGGEEVSRQWSGRTGTNKIVHFEAAAGNGAPNQRLTGRIMEIMIEKAMSHSLWGRPVVSCTEGTTGKGAQTHAA